MSPVGGLAWLVPLAPPPAAKRDTVLLFPHCQALFVAYDKVGKTISSCTSRVTKGPERERRQGRLTCTTAHFPTLTLPPFPLHHTHTHSRVAGAGDQKVGHEPRRPRSRLPAIFPGGRAPGALTLCRCPCHKRYGSTSRSTFPTPAPLPPTRQGCTIRSERGPDGQPRIVIARLMANTLSERCGSWRRRWGSAARPGAPFPHLLPFHARPTPTPGLIYPNDELVKVNDASVAGMTTQEVCSPALSAPCPRVETVPPQAPAHPFLPRPARWSS